MGGEQSTGMSSSEMQNLQFQLKFVSKSFGKNAKTSEKDSEKDVERCKQAMQKGNVEVAKIYAQSAIRKKNESVNFIKLGARMEAVASRLDTAIKMKMVTKTMGSMVRGMDKVLQGMNPEHISRLMDTFEQQFENVDVASEYMQEAIGASSASATPDSEVTELMQRVADQNGLDMKRLMNDGVAVPGQQLPAVAQPAQSSQNDPELEAMSKQLAALQGAK